MRPPTSHRSLAHRALVGLFGTPLDAFTVLAALMVGLGVALYSRPVAAGGGGGGGGGGGAGEPEYNAVGGPDH